METGVPDTQYRVEERDGMLIDWDVPIAMADELVLRADVFGPLGAGRRPVLMTHWPRYLCCASTRT
jgi:uncharacterized protein